MQFLQIGGALEFLLECRFAFWLPSIDTTVKTSTISVEEGISLIRPAPDSLLRLQIFLNNALPEPIDQWRRRQAAKVYPNVNRAHGCHSADADSGNRPS